MSASPNTIAPRRGGIFGKLFAFFASFRLAVTVISLSIVLVFFGTLAQADEGLYKGQKRWFKSWVVWGGHTAKVDPAVAPPQSHSPMSLLTKSWKSPLFVFPGGYTLGAIFLVNMICGHVRRFKKPPGGLPAMLAHYALVVSVIWVLSEWVLLQSPFLFTSIIIVLLMVDLTLQMVTKSRTGVKLGVDLTHLGVAMLMIGQLATDYMAKESFMGLELGEMRQYAEHHHDFELCFITEATDAAQERVVAIPHAQLVQGAVINHPELPFTVRLPLWRMNSVVVQRSMAQELEGRLRQAFARMDSQYADTADLNATFQTDKEEGRRAVMWEDALKASGVKNVEDLTAAVAEVMKAPDLAARLASSLRTNFRKEMLAQWMMAPAELGEGRAAAMQFAAARVKADQPITEDSPPPVSMNGAGSGYLIVERPEDLTMDGRNLPGATVTLEGTAASLGDWIVHPGLLGQTLEYGGKKWSIGLRPARKYLPITLTLLDVKNNKYQGTPINKDFSSRVLLRRPGTAEEREVDIYMNYPLRIKQDNLTIFQSKMTAEAGQTGLQVVENPSWFVPYFGCALVGYGLLRHFTQSLLRHTRSSAAPTPAPQVA